MTSPILYQTKRLLRVWDSRWTRKTKEVHFRDHCFRFYSTYWWGDISQALLESEIAPYFNACDDSFTSGTILDVGAATGHFSLLAARLYPRSMVYAFEPSERQQILLTRNAKLNGIENLEVQPFGLWNRRDQLAFRTNGAESSFESVSRFRGQLPFLESVPVQSLDEWAREKKLSGVDLIKMDAEGAELEILDGAKETLQSFHPRLLIQAYHLRDGARTFERCAGMLRAQGYVIGECPRASGLLYAR